MATLSKGISFGATETVTNTKLGNLVDLGSVTNIVNADCSPSMNLADTKLADITTGNKVRGTALGNLASIPSGSGLIPFANLPLPLGSSYVSLTSIPNASLVPISLASWVDGNSFKNLASTPSASGRFPYYSIVSSLASGSVPVYDGTSGLVGGIAGSIRLVSTTTVSTGSGTGNISITEGKNYKAIIKFDDLSSSSADFTLLKNSINTSYEYASHGYDLTGAAKTANSSSASSIKLNVTNPSQRIYIDLNIMSSSNGNQFIINGRSMYPNGSGLEWIDFSGQRAGSAAVTSFAINMSTGTFSGTVLLYEYIS